MSLLILGVLTYSTREVGLIDFARVGSGGKTQLRIREVICGPLLLVGVRGGLFMHLRLCDEAAQRFAGRFWRFFL